MQSAARPLEERFPFMSRRSKPRTQANGPSPRQLKVAEEIRRTLHEIFTRAHWREPVLAAATLTVTGARISPDLKNCTVFISPLGGENEETVLKALNHARGFVRSELARAMSHLRIAPDLRFEADHSFDEAAKIDALLRSKAVRRDLEPGEDEDA